MRHTSIQIIYENKDISKDLAPFLLSFSYNDAAGSNSDDISFSLQDINHYWLDNWTPSKGDKISASIITENSSLPCGTFQVDDISFSGPPSILNIKAVSNDIKKSLSGEKKNRAWENVSLKQIAADIAAKNNLSLFFDSDEIISFHRKEQNRLSDAEFLNSLCNDYGLNLKISDGKIIIYSLDDYCDKISVASLSRLDKNIISWHFNSKSANTYKAAKVKYHSPTSGQTFIAEFNDDSVEGSNRTLEISSRAESQSDAVNIAKKKLSQINSKEISGSITIIGDTRFLAGSNITLNDFGMFSGKYFLASVTHSVSQSGYTTELKFQMGKSEKKNTKSRKIKKQSAKTLFYEGENYYHAN